MSPAERPQVKLRALVAKTVAGGCTEEDAASTGLAAADAVGPRCGVAGAPSRQIGGARA